MEKNWEILSSEYLIRRPWLTARRDAVRLPDGTVNPEHYVLEYPYWINVIAITADDKFVFIRQYRHGLREYNYEIPAGVVEKGESPEEAARRELLEETGFGGGKWEPWMKICGNPSTTDNLTHCFLATGVERLDTQHLEATEDISVHLLSRRQVRDILIADTMRQSLMLAPLWKLFALKGMEE